jgi:hypothetical protein
VFARVIDERETDMMVRQQARQFVRNFFANMHAAARAVGPADFLRHLKTQPDLGLEPPMPRELPRAKETVIASGATADRKRQVTTSGPIR